MADYGIDVSGYNTITNWPAVRGVGNSWMWSKATQGGGYTNPQFGTQIAGARAAGLLVGAYHFPDPNVSVAVNVGHFRSVATSQHALDAGCFVPLLDMEDDPADGIVWTPSSANAFVKAFRDEFRRESGVHELCVYGSESWFATGKLNPSQWADDGVVLCIAQYSGVPGKVDWTDPRAAVHQYTSSAPTPGATKVTDRSVTLGGWSAASLTIGHAPPASGKDDDMSDPFYCQTEQLDDKGQKTGTVLKGLYSGGYLSGLSPADIAVWDAKIAAGKNECTWITWQQWQDWDGKGNRQLIVSQQLLAAQQQTNDVLTKTLAAIQTMPAGTGGVDLAAVEAAAKDGGSAGAAAAIAGTTITLNPPKN